MKHLVALLVLSTAILAQTPTITAASGNNCEKGKCLACAGAAGNFLCSMCVKSVFSLTAIGKCVTEGLPANCLMAIGLSTNMCTACEKGYYLKIGDGTCTKVETAIPDCEGYTSVGGVVKCSSCGNAKAPNVGGTACEAPTAPIANCSIHSGVTTMP